MKNNFGPAQNDIKMKHISNTWMCWCPGVDELKIDDQGWFKPKSFLQETGKEGQHRPRIGNRPTKSVVQDARQYLAHLPSLFFLSKVKQYLRSFNNQSQKNKERFLRPQLVTLLPVVSQW